eukprot:TRINITY_DN14894_c0_g1_i1.p1 TRINITY_DN14894_c0_g1~~TRINITY_DN14894_c0_g1_i1.p1  ORF type:complete len:801 (+),score=124.22 TRINITY_DN14894_c0_g1_i1:237-2639(+)
MPSPSRRAPSQQVNRLQLPASPSAWSRQWTDGSPCQSRTPSVPTASWDSRVAPGVRASPICEADRNGRLPLPASPSVWSHKFSDGTPCHLRTACHPARSPCRSARTQDISPGQIQASLCLQPPSPVSSKAQDPSEHGSAGGDSPMMSPSLMRAALRSSASQLTSGQMSAISDCSIGAAYGEVLGSLDVSKLLHKVTGEVGDIHRDARLAYGDATLTFEDVSFSVSKCGDNRTILAPVSGHFEPGTLVALMGPSGCGKTTLLDILAEKKTAPYSGKVHLNGRPRDCLFRRLTSYISQDDIMPANLTVKEAVLFHTALKTEVPSGVTRQMLEKAAELRLFAVGLQEVMDERIGDEMVRGISGGQRRRVSLACGLASGAQIFFCDEPTSGLSATDAEKCTRLMRLLAKKYGVTIIVAIHQPRYEVANLFDHLLLLTANPGEVVYNGSLREAPQYWSDAGFPVPDHATPTDYFLDMVTPGVPDSKAEFFVRYYQEHAKLGVDRMVQREMSCERRTAMDLLEARRQTLQLFGKMPPLRRSVYGVRFHTQLWKVFGRHLRLCLRDQQGILTELVVAIVKALVVGVAYVGIGTQSGYNQIGFYYMLVMTCALDGIKVMPKSIQERTIMKLETSEALYSDWAYIISFTSINLVVSILGNQIFVMLVFLLSQLDWGCYPVLLVWTTLIGVAMDSLYMMVAAIAKDSTSAQILILPFLTVFLLFNGFTVSRESVPDFMAWALEISPVSHTMEEIIIGVNQRLPNHELDNVVLLWGYKPEFEVALGNIVGWVFIFRITQVISLRRLNSIKR